MGYQEITKEGLPKETKEELPRANKRIATKG